MQPGELIASDQGARPVQPSDLTAAWVILAEVMDPEVPVVSVVDLGIVRDLDWQAGHLARGGHPDLLRLPRHRSD